MQGVSLAMTPDSRTASKPRAALLLFLHFIPPIHILYHLLPQSTVRNQKVFSRIFYRKIGTTAGTWPMSTGNNLTSSYLLRRTKLLNTLQLDINIVRVIPATCYLLPATSEDVNTLKAFLIKTFSANQLETFKRAFRNRTKVHLTPMMLISGRNQRSIPINFISCCIVCIMYIYRRQDQCKKIL